MPLGEETSSVGLDLSNVQKRHKKLILPGIEGYPYRTKRGQISLRLFKVPDLLSPCLNLLPTTLQDKETRIRHRHVDFLVNRDSTEKILLRSEVISYLRHLLVDDGCVEVQTPILADTAGGAIARPFHTSSVEFVDRQLSLRIAPELWLKRLVLGGIDRVFEIGQCFRNEGAWARTSSKTLVDCIQVLT